MYVLEVDEVNRKKNGLLVPILAKLRLYVRPYRIAFVWNSFPQ